MGQPISFGDVSQSKVNNLFKKLYATGTRHAEEHYANEPGIRPENRDTETERILRSRIKQLEEDLLKTSEERDAALEENRNSINELNDKLMSMKSVIKGMVLEKKKRITHLEKKINKAAK